MTTNLSAYTNTAYNPGSTLKRTLWYFTNLLLFKTMLPFPSTWKAAVLRMFGAQVGAGVVIKPNVNIKYPWYLHVGDHVWIGEGVWVDNLAQVNIGSHSCLSQDAYLLTGSHDYTTSTFELIVKPITLAEGVWIGAKATVCPGVTCKSHSVLAVGSVATHDLEAYTVYQGNPAQPKRERKIG